MANQIEELVDVGHVLENQRDVLLEGGLLLLLLELVVVECWWLLLVARNRQLLLLLPHTHNTTILPLNHLLLPLLRLCRRTLIPLILRKSTPHRLLPIPIPMPRHLLHQPLRHPSLVIPQCRVHLIKWTIKLVCLLLGICVVALVQEKVHCCLVGWGYWDLALWAFREHCLLLRAKLACSDVGKVPLRLSQFVPKSWCCFLQYLRWA